MRKSNCRFLEKYNLQIKTIIIAGCLMISKFVISLVVGEQDLFSLFLTLFVTVICVSASCLTKERYWHKASLPIFVFVFLLLIYQYISTDTWWINIGGFWIKTAALLPLLAIPVSKAITTYQNYSFIRAILVFIPIICCFMLVILQYYYYPVLFGFLVMYIVVLKLFVEKRVTPNYMFVVYKVMTLLLLVAVICILMEVDKNDYDLYDYPWIRIKTILERGKNQPQDIGWVRRFMDTLIKEAPLIGKTNYVLDYKDEEAPKYLYDMLGCNSSVILAALGWIPFVIFNLFNIVFICLLSKMSRKTNQSLFANYLSFTLSTVMMVKTAFCILSFLLLDANCCGMPFSFSHTNNQVDAISLGIILGLYTRRNEQSEIRALNKPWVLSEEIRIFYCETVKDINEFKEKIFFWHPSKNPGKSTNRFYNKRELVRTENKPQRKNIDVKTRPSKINYAFISYSSNNKKSADIIEEILKKNGIFVWRDSKGIRPGDKYAETLVLAIEKCSCFVLLLTAEAQKSQWVAKEVERAINYGKPIVTIEIGNFEINKEFEMYVSNTQREKVQYIVENSKEIEKVVRSVKRYIDNI